MEQKILNDTRELLEASKDALVKCIEDMNEFSHNSRLKGGDATDWVKRYQTVRNKLNECEDILDDLKEKYSDTCFNYGDEDNVEVL